MKTAEIEREYGPSPGSTHLHGVTYDGHDVWSVAGDKLQAFDSEAESDEVHSVQRKETWVGVYSSERSERFGVRYPHWLPIQESERVLNALAVKLFPCFLHAIAEMRR
jgi:hypothetical protein